MTLLPNFMKEERQWGGYTRYTLNEQSTVKIISVAPGQAFSLQTHSRRDEFWAVLSGDGVVHLGGVDHQATFGSCFQCERGTVHRVTGGSQGITFLEISKGEFDENDIVRLEDRYGRT